MAKTNRFREQLDQLREAGTLAGERVLTGAQGTTINTTEDSGLINMCANNYLGLSNDPRLIRAAEKAMAEYGFGLSSVRFICGTQTIHKELEEKVASFFGFEDAILYSSCFDANGGLFETLLGENDAIISDELNHASIIDGVRLSKAKRWRYRNNNMADLERCLQEADEAGSDIRLIATDGVFSMDGIIADLRSIVDLADKYNALVMVDDSHASGFVGRTGRGTPEYCGVMGEIDILTSTFGKALGGASGGFTAASRDTVAWLRQKSRPYLFSNSLAPAICGATLEVLSILETDASLCDKTKANAAYFREKMTALGLDLIPGEHAIVPVMVYDARKAIEVADFMFRHGVYVIAFKFPVVPEGKARIRTQISAAHTREDLAFAIDAFARCKREIEEEALSPRRGGL